MSLEERLQREHADAKRGLEFAMECHAEGCDRPAHYPLPFCYPCWVRIPFVLKMDFYLVDAEGYSHKFTARPGWVDFMKECVAALELKAMGL